MSELKERVFKICNKDKLSPFKIYVKIKVIKIGKRKTLIQIVDNTDAILQEKFKEENDTLSLVNACVSHELRNPLNSITA